MGGSLGPHFKLQYLQRSEIVRLVEEKLGFIELELRSNDVTPIRDWRMTAFDSIVSGALTHDRMSDKFLEKVVKLNKLGTRYSFDAIVGQQRRC